MKKQKTSIKKMIKKQIEYRLQKPKEYQKHSASMNERDIKRICGTGAIAVDIFNFSRTEIRNGKAQNIQVVTNTYQKKAHVDYDVVICIPNFKHNQLSIRLK
jgi:hypothetical protein